MGPEVGLGVGVGMGVGAGCPFSTGRVKVTLSDEPAARSIVRNFPIRIDDPAIQSKGVYRAAGIRVP